MARYATPVAPLPAEPPAEPAPGPTLGHPIALPPYPLVLVKPLPAAIVAALVKPPEAEPAAETVALVESAPVEAVTEVEPIPEPPALDIDSSTVLEVPAASSLSSEIAVDSFIRDAGFVDTVTPEAINQLQAGFYPPSNQVPAHFAVDRFKLRFKSRNELGHWVSIRAELFVPRVDQPAEFPMFVYGAGTTGINNKCAPLDEDTLGRNWGQYQVHLLSYAAQGFITVLPHWQGYDDQTRKHNYFIADLEASIMLDVTRAVYELFNNNHLVNVQARPAQAVFYGGYSQGGHGAFAALDAASEYAPELPIRGIVGHATAPSVEALLRERPQLAPYIIYAYLNYYGGDVIHPDWVFQPNWLPNFYNDASSKCVDEAYEYYPANPNQMYRPEFLNVLYSERLADMFPAFKAALDRNYVGDSANTSVPVVLFHGGADPIVTPETHERFVSRLCNMGKNVNYKVYPDINHFQTRQASFVDSVNWMRNVLTGQIPESQCSAFFTSKFE